MIEETGVIVEKNDLYAKIQVERKEACKGCAAKSVCHPFDESENLVEIFAKNSVNAQIGDKVKVAIPEITFLKASFITYLIPVIFLFVGSFVGELLFHSDILNFLIGSIFFIVSFFLIHSYSKKKHNEFTPVIIEILK
jgi:sigma-E factor negative regulatory protein RseC